MAEIVEVEPSTLFLRSGVEPSSAAIGFRRKRCEMFVVCVIILALVGLAAFWLLLFLPL